MATRLVLAVAASLFATAAAGQAEPDVTHDGRWLATIRADGGKPQSARFVLRQFSGDWIGASGRASATGNACAGRTLPITVQSSTASALAFTVWGSQVSPSCANLTIEARSVGNDVFEGKVESVGTIRVTRR